MPSKAAHISAANHNQLLIDYLLQSDTSFGGWVTTAAFYKALHVVEAVLAHNGNHTDDHSARHKLLKTTRKYEQIWKHYRPLYDASLIARYLRDNTRSPTYDVFSQYMDDEKVQQVVLRHYLAQVEKSAGHLLGDPGFLRSC